MLCILSWTVPATAQEPIALKWTGPAACPSGDDVLSETRRLLGGFPEDGVYRLEARANLERRADGWRLTLDTVRRGGAAPNEGSRILDAADCGELGQAAALVLALAYDPERVAAARGGPARPPARTVSPAPSTPAEITSGEAVAPFAPLPPPLAPPVVAPAPARTAPAPPPARPWRPSLHMAAQLDGGGLPGVSLGASAAAQLDIGRFGVALGGTLMPASRTELDSRPGAGGDFSLWTVNARGCVTPWIIGRDDEPERESGDIALAGCLQIEVGRMSADGFGVSNPGSGGTLWLAPGALAKVSVALGKSLSLRLDGGIAVPLLPHTFVLENVGDVHTSEPVNGRGALGIDLRF